MAFKKVVRKKIVRKIPKFVKRGMKSMSKGSSDKNPAPYLMFGALFGYFLSKSRATDYDTIVDMFRLREFQLYGVIGTAIAVVTLGLLFLRKKGIPTRSGKNLDWEKVEFEPSRLWGAFIFGAGWAIAGTCPGTSLTQLGEGKVVALFTIVGILAGVWVYKKKFNSSSSNNQAC